MFCSERKISFLYAEKDERNNLPSFWGMIFVLNAQFRWLGVPHCQVIVLSNGYQIMLMKPILFFSSERKIPFLTCAILPSNGRNVRKSKLGRIEFARV